ncbi:MAG: ABC transporter substrate-binding protein [Alphaproteobacteria bacterium]
MFIRRVIFPAIFFALIAASSAVFAATEDAAQFVQRLGDQTIDTLRAPYLTLDERRDQFRGLLSQGFDIPFIGRFVIGRYWRGATSEQRGDYMALYSEFFLNTYTSRLGESDGQTFVVTGARAANAKDVVVRSLLNRAGGQPFVTDWRVRNFNGRYRVIDVMVEGISLALTQRSEFASVARRGGLDGLLATLRARTANFSEIASLN